MNSNRTIEVDRIFCGSCQELFYEFQNYELECCPHCKTNLNDGNVEVDRTVDINVEVDYKTGELKMI